MKVIIAGSRSFRHPADYQLVVQAVRESGFTPTTILSGMAKGVDKLGVRYAVEHRIPWRPFYARWDEHGPRSAGMIRNRAMADHADALVAVWDEESKGTLDMIEVARKKGLPVYVLNAGL